MGFLQQINTREGISAQPQQRARGGFLQQRGDVSITPTPAPTRAPTPRVIIKPEKPKSSKSIFSGIQKAVKDALTRGKGARAKLSNVQLREREGLGVPIGRFLQKAPTPDLGTKGQKFFKASDTETKIVNFLSNFPSMIAQSYGQTLEQLATKEGKERARKDAVNLPKTMSEIKSAIDDRDWQKALETATNNSALMIGLDVADFIPLTFLAKFGFKGVTTSLKSRKIAQTIVKEAIEPKIVKPKPKVITPKVVEKPKVVKIEPKVAKPVVEIVPKKVEPVVKPTAKVPSKIALSIEAKAIERKLTKGFEGLAGFDRITIKDQARRVADLIKTDFAKARRIVRGEEPVPSGMRGTALITGIEEQIIKTGDSKLAHELANSPLVSETSVAAQELRLAAERVPDSLTKQLQDVKRAKEEAIKKKTGKSVSEATKSTRNQIKKEITKKTPKREDWGAFLKEIQC